MAISARDQVRAICGPLGAQPALARADALLARLHESEAASRPAVATELALPARISAREAEVLRLLAAGWDNAAIAAQLYLSINTIKTHVANIYGKLGVTNRAAANRAALDLGIA